MRSLKRKNTRKDLTFIFLLLKPILASLACCLNAFLNPTKGILLVFPRAGVIRSGTELPPDPTAAFDDPRILRREEHKERNINSVALFPLLDAGEDVRKQARWEAAGYSEIVAAHRQGADLVFEFADGDVVVAPAATFGIAGDYTIEVDPDDPLSARVDMPGNGSTVLSWLRIRAATDAEFAQEMRRRDAEQSRRLGLRLRALREDKNLSQRDLATLVGMSPPQLSKIESGAFDLRVSTVPTLVGESIVLRLLDHGGGQDLARGAVRQDTPFPQEH